VAGQGERYAAISAHLHQARLPFTVEFQYLQQGIRVGALWYPIVKMDWVEGLLLNEFVRQHLDSPAMLEALSHLWAKLARRLARAGAAHADLQHGNILLVPGRTENHLAIKLIDYDGMFVPALAGMPSGEVGHPAYQHPQRLREATYSADVDRFPVLAIYVAIRALMIGGRPLWDRYDNGDNLLFRRQDFEAPSRSLLFAELLKLPDPITRSLIEKLIDAARKPLDQTVLLNDSIGGEPIAPGPPETQWPSAAVVEPSQLAFTPPLAAEPAFVATLAPPVAAAVAPAATATPQEAQPDFAFSTPATKRGARTRRNMFTGVALVAAAALMVFALLAVAGVVFLPVLKGQLIGKAAPALGDNGPIATAKIKVPARKGEPLKKEEPKKEEPKKEEPKKEEPKKEEPKKDSKADTTIVFLSDLKEKNVRVESTWFRKNGTLVDGYKRDLPVVVMGVKSPHALFIHPPDKSYASVSYDIEGSYAQFVTQVAIPNLVADQSDPASPLTFEILGNGKSIWKSRPLAKRGDTQDCDIGLPGINHLELRVHCPGAGNWAWAVWLEPRLIRQSISNPLLSQAESPLNDAKLPASLKNSLGMEFVLIPKGKSWLGGGSDWDVADRKWKIRAPQKEVSIDYDLELAAHTVTQMQWQEVMGSNPSFFSRKGAWSSRVTDVSDADLNRFPVESMTWNEVQEFLEKLNDKEKGKEWRYRLPKEEEWEYACRNAASTKEECAFDFYCLKGTNNLSSKEASFFEERIRPTKVGSYAPNKLGLYDMHGNVRQWCDDLWASTGTDRVVRGGSWLDPREYCRAASRAGLAPSRRFAIAGFRLARVPVPATSALDFKQSKFTTLSIKGVATVSSARIFSTESIVFPQWGPQTYHGVPFVVDDPDGGKARNTICLYSKNGAISAKMPKTVRVACGLPAKEIHLLGGAGWGVPWTKKDTLSMVVRLEYSDGVTEDHPLTNGVHLTDWAVGPEVRDCRSIGVKRLGHLSIVPKQKSVIKTIVFRKGTDDTSPFVMSITIEAPKTSEPPKPTNPPDNGRPK
jgi:formylglycine-generating enzyme required for sulfatase activity